MSLVELAPRHKRGLTLRGPVVNAAGTLGFGDLFTGRSMRNDQPTVYVCRGVTCQEPTADWADLRGLLWAQTH